MAGTSASADARIMAPAFIFLVAAPYRACIRSAHDDTTIINSMEPEWIKAGDRRFDDELSEQIAWLMDSAIQIGPVSIGLDGLIGLIPGLGDVLTNIMSAVIVMRALQNGVHRAAILRMLLNLGIDTAVGSIPVVGDIFDFAYKANMKNIRIYRES